MVQSPYYTDWETEAQSRQHLAQVLTITAELSPMARSSVLFNILLYHGLSHLSQPHLLLLECEKSKLAFCISCNSENQRRLFFFENGSTFIDYKTVSSCCYNDKFSLVQTSDYSDGCLKITPCFASAAKVVDSGTADPENNVRSRMEAFQGPPLRCSELNHRDAKYSRGNTANNIAITLYGDR